MHWIERLYDGMICCFCFFRWGREKYSKGREVGDEGEGSGGRGGGKRGLGTTCPPPQSYAILIFLWFPMGKQYACIPMSFSYLKVIFFHRSRSLWATLWENLLMPYANNKGADQPVHLRSLISAFVVRCLASVISILAKSKISKTPASLWSRAGRFESYLSQTTNLPSVKLKTVPEVQILVQIIHLIWKIEWRATFFRADWVDRYLNWQICEKALPADSRRFWEGF